MSIIFYSIGNFKALPIMLITCLINYYCAKNINQFKFIIGLSFNVGILCYFKYVDFFIDNINTLFSTNLPLIKVILPLGISFYIFQNLGYLIDVYNKQVKPSTSLINYATYITMFPQLVAGPIVRYQVIESQLETRIITYTTVSLGIKRLIKGLVKKVIIANSIATIIIELNTIEISIVGTWIIAALYLIQLYFDFSGYSDMAIGLGKIFGFDFNENFNSPLLAKNITDFWRKWHISLTTWIKDYIYIPLKGSRVKIARYIFNLIIVWLFTGLWHGANWNFIIWGLYFGSIILFERKVIKLHSSTYTWLLLIIGFVLFKYSITESIEILKIMFFNSNYAFINQDLIYYLSSYLVFIIVTLSFIVLENNIKIIGIINKYDLVVYFILFIVVIAYIVDSSFNPFLYFRF